MTNQPEYNRLRIQAGLLLGLLCGVLLHDRPACGQTISNRPHPSFLVILCDDLGYGDLGCYGHPTIKTPRLDRLATEGMKLTQCYAGAPVCSPSRAALLTGRNPNRYGIRDWIPEGKNVFLPRDEVTIATLLKQAGYRTCLSGKWHLSSRLDGSEPTPGDHGFDRWLATQNNALPNHLDPKNFIKDGQPLGPLKGHATTLAVDEAIRFLDEVRDQPFFLFVSLHAPHEPLAVADSETKPYATIPDATKRIYYGSVSLLDREIGRLLDALDGSGRRDSTLVVFSSDNGPETLHRYKGSERSHGSPGSMRGMKLHLTEGGIRVPGIVRWPGKIQPGTVSNAAVGFTDLLPTLCAIAGIAPPAGRALDGTNLLPLIEGKPLKREAPLYWQYDRAIGGWNVAIRQGPWKLLADESLGRFALFNIVDDPGETRDLALTEPERVRELSTLLIGRYREINGKKG